MKEIYLDYAATTPLDSRVKAAMDLYWSKEFGNPSSLHKPGRNAKNAMDNSRSTIANFLNCRPEEIIFTGSGTESINLAIFGVTGMHQAKLGATKQGHLITSEIEHHAVLHSIEVLEKKGFEVTRVKVDKYGLVDPQEVKSALRPDTILVSIMYANNEIGTIQLISEIAKVIKDFRRGLKIYDPPFFHSDACQAAGALDLDVEKLGVDLLSINGSKIYGPKGVGSLYVRRGVGLKPLIYGGGQEKNLRSGTENVPGIVGFAKALEIAQGSRVKENERLLKLRDYFIEQVMKKIPRVVLNGHPTKRLPNNINVSVLDIEGEASVLYLDAKGIYISTGSACTSESLEPSHVIRALGRPYEYSHGSLRFTLGRQTTKKDLDYVLRVFPKVVEKLRMISPINLKIE